MRFVGKLVLVIGALLVAALAVGYGWLRSSLPQTEGEISLAGLKGEITIARDAHGVPHISASGRNDLAFGLGFAHAQDRLWQMDMNRRIGRGRLSEAVGPDGLGIDKYMRTLGFAVKSETAYERLPDDAKTALQAYAAGVNAFLATRSGALPPEFLLTGVEPEPWTPSDTLVWMKLMWLDLSGNMRYEIARARALSKLTPDQLATLYPSYPGDSEPAFPDLAAIYGQSGLTELAAVVGPEPQIALGSNNWVVSGEMTKSGKPMLANDPHLGLTTPSIWYLVRLHDNTTDSNLVGVSFPGSPSIVLGRNDRIAWGFTNTDPDIQDLFIEKLTEDRKGYLTPEGVAEFKIRPEVIMVKGGEDVALTVRETRHGPVLSDVSKDAEAILKDGYVVALQWTALMDEDRAVVAMMNLGDAKNFEDFKAAGLDYAGPEQNMIYADVDGNIGYYAPALVPIRNGGNGINGRLPSPGWVDTYDWSGFIPYGELPTRYNPDSGVIATANEKIVDNDYPHFITRDWSLPYRGNRIRHLLTEKAPHDVDTFAAIHGDIVSDLARDIQPWLIASLKDDTPAKKLLADWDGAMTVDSAAALLFETFLLHYQPMLIADELGDIADNYSRQKPGLLKSSLYWTAVAAGADPKDDAYYALPALGEAASLAWCDNVKTEDVAETCADLATNALAQAVADLTAEHGADMKAWRWGNAHRLEQTHRPLSNVPQLAGFFALSAEQGGSQYTVNVAGNGNDKGTHGSDFGASYRGIFDLADLDNSRFVQPTGQSGNPLSPHYGDLFDLWRETRSFTIPTKEVIPAGADVLTLKPAE